jgi:hypothetical protein
MKIIVKLFESLLSFGKGSKRANLLRFHPLNCVLDKIYLSNI